MLKLLDVIIGVATVMLLYSMAVTVITQFVTSAIRSRGRNLRAGIAGLLHQIDPSLGENVTKSIATAVLKHPLIGGRYGAMGTVIHRAELTILLMELAAGETPNNLTPPEKASLQQMLSKNNIPDPAGTLSNIRNIALQLESANPQLANDVRHSMAILQEAKSEFVAKIHGWFDQTVDRVSARFIVTARTITFIASLAVAFAMQLDVIALINRLSLDDAFRQAVASQAQPILQSMAKSSSSNQSSDKTNTSGNTGPNAKQDKSTAIGNVADKDQNTSTSTSGNKTGANPAGTPTPSTDRRHENQPDNPGQSGTTSNSEQTKQLQELLSKNGLIAQPEDWKDLFQSGWLKILGIVLSALLLSLGAPFWYGMLQNLLKLRSALTQKDDAQRTTRQTTQPDPTTNVTVNALPAIIQGEQGDLQALG